MKEATHRFVFVSPTHMHTNTSSITANNNIEHYNLLQPD